MSAVGGAAGSGAVTPVICGPGTPGWPVAAWSLTAGAPTASTGTELGGRLALAGARLAGCRDRAQPAPDWAPGGRPIWLRISASRF